MIYLGEKLKSGETNYDAAKREFKEETGMEILNLNLIGNMIIEYPDRIFDMDIFISDKYSGAPRDFEENSSMWVSINEINNKNNVYPSLELLKPQYIDYLNNSKDGFEFYIRTDEYHKTLERIIR